MLDERGDWRVVLATGLAASAITILLMHVLVG